MKPCALREHILNLVQDGIGKGIEGAPGLLRQLWGGRHHRDGDCQVADAQKWTFEIEEPEGNFGKCAGGSAGAAMLFSELT